VENQDTTAPTGRRQKWKMKLFREERETRMIRKIQEETYFGYGYRPMAVVFLMQDVYRF
jgi:hypothetical protein